MKVDIQSDGRTVWVNGADGCCVGRFSQYGVEIHHTAEAQMTTGDQCLDCKAGPTNLLDWEHFKVGMKSYYGVEISDKHRPKKIIE